jgi:hypothetical protein
VERGASLEERVLILESFPSYYRQMETIAEQVRQLQPIFQLAATIPPEVQSKIEQLRSMQPQLDAIGPPGRSCMLNDDLFPRMLEEARKAEAAIRPKIEPAVEAAISKVRDAGLEKFQIASLESARREMEARLRLIPREIRRACGW